MGVLVAFAVMMGVAVDAPAAPLRDRIDRIIEEAAGGAVAAPATDAEFVRRVWLDLAGFVPTTSEARAFIDDPSPYKRERLVDRLLASISYARRMQYVFDEMWMERRSGTLVPAADWRKWLFACFRENRPYDAMVREVLEADGSGDGQERAPARFLLDRGAEPNLLVRDVGRMFLGRDYQCAQCHDHPLIEDYYQRHYYGLYAFVSRTTAVTDPRTSRASLAEKAEGDVTFVSVFKRSVTSATGPRVLDGAEVVESAAEAGRAYLVPPGDNVASRPVASRRARLGQELTSGQVAAFDRNIANRLWSITMKRGLVEPVDFDHADNPPSHPQLLDLLGREFRAGGCDIKAFLRELMLTRTYARSSEPPPSASEDLADPARFAVANLRPMSAEQMGWSVLQATGVLESYRLTEINRIDGVDTKLRDILKEQPGRRELEIEGRVHDQLAPAVSAFVTYFSAGEARPPDSIDANVHQALFLSNGGSIQSWLAPSGSNTTGRALTRPEPDGVAEELYLAILSRRPTAEERSDVAQLLTTYGAEKRAEAVKELAFALLASAEFRFQH